MFLRFFSFLALAGTGVLTAPAVCETWGVLCEAGLGAAFLPVAGRGVESESDESLSDSDASDDCSSAATAYTRRSDMAPRSIAELGATYRVGGGRRSASLVRVVEDLERVALLLVGFLVFLGPVSPEAPTCHISANSPA